MAAFNVVHTVLFTPFIYPMAEQLVLVWATKADNVRRSVSGPDLRDWQARATAFQAIGGYLPDVRLSSDLAVGTIRGVYIEPSVLKVLSVAPELGRGFNEADVGLVTGTPTIVSHGFWMNALGGDPAAIGRELFLNRDRHLIIGVMPPRFSFPDDNVDVILPLGPATVGGLETRGVPILQVIGRLKPDVDLRRAQADLTRITNTLALEYPATNKEVRPVVYPFLQSVVANYRRALVGFSSATVLVFLIACVNAGSLLFGSAIFRKKEFAIRAALGAERRHLASLPFAEASVIATMAAPVGIVLCVALLVLIQKLHFTDVPGLSEVSLHGYTAFCGIALTILAGLLSGAIPSWTAGRISLSQSLKLGGTTSAGSSSSLTRQLTVGVQAVLAVTLAVSSFALIRDFVGTARSPWGFDPTDATLVEVTVGGAGERDLSAQQEFAEAALDALQKLPGVAEVGMGYGVPVRWSEWTPMHIALGGRLVTTDWHAGMWKVSRGYFEALGIPLIHGRTFTIHDTRTSQRVVIVSQSLARRLWSTDDVVSRALDIMQLKGIDTGNVSESLRKRVRSRDNSLVSDPDAWQPAGGGSWVIIGVVGDVRMFSLDVRPQPAFYISHLQQFLPLFSYGGATPQFVLRHGGSATDIALSARQAIHAVNPHTSFGDIVDMNSVIARSLGSRGIKRFLLIVFCIFGGLALVLIATGTYAATSLVIAERRDELVTRATLGATRYHLVRVVALEGSVAAVLGVIAGSWAGQLVTSSLKGQMTAFPGADWWSIAAAAIVVLAVSLITAVIPAVRASRVSPIDVRRVLLP